MPTKILSIAALLLVALQASAKKDEETTHTTLGIATEPKGAMVFIDGERKSASPLKLRNPKPGNHLIVIRKKGYREVRRTIKIDRGQRLIEEFKLRPLTGLLVIHSNPTGAAIRIDGADKGNTPKLLTDVPLGKHRLQITSPGHVPKTIDVVIENRRPKHIEIDLTSDSATVILDSEPSGAAVTLNGVAKGTTPVRLSPIPAGESTIELAMEGYEPYSKTLRLTAGQEDSLTAKLIAIPSELKIVTIPSSARIYVNNQFRGESPVTLEKLAPGSYRVRAELPAHSPMARTVELGRAKSVVEEFRFERNAGTLQITTAPAGATILVDGKEVGKTKAKANKTDQISEVLIVDPVIVGGHQVQVNAKGYFPKRFAIAMAKDQSLVKHVTLVRRFIPDYEIRTATDVYIGVFTKRDPRGNVTLETKQGIFKTFKLSEIRVQRPLRRDTEEEE